MRRSLSFFLTASLTLAQSYIMTTAAGTSRLLDGHAATSVPLRYPFGIAEDTGGNLYVADTDDNRIRRVDANGVITTLAGNGGAGFSGDNGPATAATLNAPQGLKLDGKGNLFFADYGNKRVRRIVLATGVITTVAGNGNYLYSGDGGPATSAGMDPYDIAVDGSDNLYIADFANNRIRRVSAADGTVLTVAGTGYPGDGDNGTATFAQLNGPRGISVNAQGSVFFVDSFNNRVKRVDLSSNHISTAIGSGSYGFGQPALDGDGEPAVNASLLAPYSTAVEPNGNVLLVCAQEVWRVTVADGMIHSIAGNGSAGFAGDGASSASAEFEQPVYIASAPNGDVLISDTGNFRVRRIRANVINTIVGIGVLDHVPATASFLDLPDGIAPDGLGGLLIDDSADSRIRAVSPDGTISTFAGTGVRGTGPNQFFFPTGLAVDLLGSVYVADTSNSRVTKILPGGIATVFAGGNGGGFGGDGYFAAHAQLNGPTGVAVDPGGNVYIADSGNSRIRVVNPVQNISTLAGTGTSGFSGDNGPASQASLSVNDLAYFGGSLYFADNFANRIRKIDLATKIITTVAGNGSAGYSGDGGPATEAQLTQPRGIAFDAAGNMYIADWGNAVVRRVSNGVISTIAGNGQPNFNVETGTALGVSIDPTRVAVDRDGTIYIVDESNDRVRRLRPQIPASMGATGSGTFAGAAGTTISISVEVLDASGRPAGNVVVNFSVTGGPAVLVNSTATTDGNGLATVQVTLGPDTGTATVAAAAQGLAPATLTINITAIPPAPPVPEIDPHGVLGSGLSSPPVEALSKGGLASVEGNNFGIGPVFQSLTQADLVNGALPLNFRGICVMVGGNRAPILGASDSQINFQTPAVSGSSTAVTVVTGCDSASPLQSNAATVVVQGATPELFYFSFNSDGHNPVAAMDPITGAFLAASSLFPGSGIAPAKPGEYVTVYGTGFGATDPAVAPGVLSSAAARVSGDMVVMLGGKQLPAEKILYAGVTPGSAGLYQINLLIPDDTPDGNLPLVVSIGGTKSPSGAYLTVLAN